MIKYVFIQFARWENPATYTIVEVLDLVFVESTNTESDKRSFTKAVGIIYESLRKYHIHQIGQLCSC